MLTYCCIVRVLFFFLNSPEFETTDFNHILSDVHTINNSVYNFLTSMIVN